MCVGSIYSWQSINSKHTVIKEINWHGGFIIREPQLAMCKPDRQTRKTQTSQTD